MIHANWGFEVCNQYLRFMARQLLLTGTQRVGSYTSIATDSNNKVHISYRDNYTPALKYATNASGSWETSTIDSADWGGGFTSIAIDSNNKVHISYCDSTPNYDLKYATNASGAWETFTIDAGDVGTGYQPEVNSH